MWGGSLCACSRRCSITLMRIWNKRSARLWPCVDTGGVWMCVTWGYRESYWHWVKHVFTREQHICIIHLICIYIQSIFKKWVFICNLNAVLSSNTALIINIVIIANEIVECNTTTTYKKSKIRAAEWLIAFKINVFVYIALLHTVYIYVNTLISVCVYIFIYIYTCI